MKIAIFSTNYRTEIDIPLRKTINFLRKNDATVLIERNLYAQIAQATTDFPACDTIDRDHLDADLAVSIGGDGTFLNTAAIIGDSNIPILGINTGRLGFLADAADDEIEAIFNEVLRHNYRLRERSVLKISTSDGRAGTYPFALNEVAVLKQDLSSMINIHATVDGEYLNAYMADGLIVATPTGSTAYAMSVGGPLLMPQVHDLLIAPVASHSLNVRPLVIPDSCNIELEIESRSKSYLISLDGRSQLMNQHTKIHIAKADFTIKTVELAHHSFFNTLKNKLMWGIDKRN
ncbi:MAG: NAD kinase [Paludibacteraceae bacterium]